MQLSGDNSGIPHNLAMNLRVSAHCMIRPSKGQACVFPVFPVFRRAHRSGISQTVAISCTRRLSRRT